MTELTQAKAAVSAVQIFVDAAVKIASAEFEARNAEIQMRLWARLKEMAENFRQLEMARKLEVEDRGLQHAHLNQLIEIAKESGSPLLIMEAMKCFRAYVEKTPSFTRDFIAALVSIDQKIELFPSDVRSQNSADRNRVIVIESKNPGADESK